MVGDSDEKKNTGSGPAETPTLPEDFYRELLNLPSCAVNGTCDNCGRCEH